MAAQWKKVITSGSVAELLVVSASGGANNVGFYGTASYALTASYAANVSSPIFQISGSTQSSTASFAANGDILLLTGSNGITVTVTDNSSTTTASFALPQAIYTNSNVQFNDVKVDGNLTVIGTASFQNTENLLVADKFILLASGSSAKTDGGIIIQSSAAGSGYALFLEGDITTPRWGFTSSLAADTVGGAGVTPDEYAVTAKSSSTAWAANGAAPTYGGSAQGYGNMVVDSDGNIWIYSHV